MSFPVNPQFKLYLLCCFVALGGFMYGYDSGVIAAILIMVPFQQEFDLVTDTAAQTALVPVSLAASFVASFVSGFVADKLGRKRFFYVASILHVVGCIVEVTGNNQAAFFAGRILTGFGVGIYSMLVPLYQSEVAKPENRGRLITFYQIFVTLGFFVAFWLGYGTYLIEGNAAWRIPVALQLVAGAIMLFGIYFIPESPRWLIYKDRNAEALTILSHLRSKGNENDVEVQMEFTGIVQDVSFDKMRYKQRFLSLLRKGNDNNRKRTLLGMGIHTFTQLSGINALLFYLPHILESAGITEVYSALLGNGVGGAVNFVATIFVLFYIDKWDRRRILIIGAIGMAICMVAITIVSARFEQRLMDGLGVYSTPLGEITNSIDNPRATYAIIVLLCIFIAVFAMSWGPIGWIYPAEIYPQMIRANAMGVTTSCSYLFNLFVALVSPVMFKNILWGTYLFFGCMCIVMALMVYKFYPETRGRSLEEIQLIFSGALIDERPDAHHPATAAEALLHLEQIQLNDKKHEHMQKYPFDYPTEWSDAMVVSSPRNVSRVLNNNRTSRDATDGVRSHHRSSLRSSVDSITSWAPVSRSSSSSSIELSIKPSSTNIRKPATPTSNNVNSDILPSSTSTKNE